MHLKKGIFETFFLKKKKPEGEIVVQRKLKVEYRKNEFKKKEIKKNKRSSKNGNGKTDGECET